MTSVPPKPASRNTAPARTDAPDFKTMTPAQKLAYARQRIKSDLSRDSNGNAPGRAS